MPTVTYRTPTGQTVTTDLQNAPPQVQILYQQLPQSQAQTQQAQAGAAVTTAEIPGAQARSTTAGIQAQQAAALQNLGKDLSNKMTLGSALKKYTALGMSPDEVFKQYLAESPWGMPNETPQKLQEMGISANALGQIGTPGSFMDRYNTKNAIEGLQQLEKLWHQTSGLSKLPFLGDATPSGQAYDAARTIFGNHLATLIPGASGAASTGASLLNTLPGVGDLTQLEPGAASGRFNAVQDQLLKTKGYNLSDLGLAAPSQNASVSATQSAQKATPQTGGDILSNLISDLGGQAQALSSRPSLATFLDPNAVKQSVQQSNPLTQLQGITQNYADIAKNPVQAFEQHPLNTTLAVLGPLLGLKGGMTGEAGATDAAANEGATAAAEDVFAKAPGKLQQLFTPGKAKNVIGQIRDNIISNADKIDGNVVKGDTLASQIRGWANQAKLSNLPDASAIEDAAKNAEEQYAGKTFKPSDLRNIYDNIEKGYTKGGEPRSATASYIDRGIKQILANQIEQMAPGFAKTSDLFQQTYQAEKSPVRGVAKRAAGVGLGLGGLDFVRHILGL